ncbi:hypothetical protein PUN28_005001 [Cardiocondyla obscurior]|uniref:Uncharacterized protein n=1 Tax=Cardiocondyla obscurior TaxID=286306 RepID=A0AAW2GIK3_9HYME
MHSAFKKFFFYYFHALTDKIIILNKQAQACCINNLMFKKISNIFFYRSCKNASVYFCEINNENTFSLFLFLSRRKTSSSFRQSTLTGLLRNVVRLSGPEFIIFLLIISRKRTANRLTFSPVILRAPMCKYIFQICRTDTVSPRRILQWFYKFSSFSDKINKFSDTDFISKQDKSQNIYYIIDMKLKFIIRHNTSKTLHNISSYVISERSHCWLMVGENGRISCARFIN